MADPEAATARRLAYVRDRGCRDDLAGAPFALEDPLFNAIVCWGWEALEEIAELVGADPAPHRSSTRGCRPRSPPRSWGRCARRRSARRWACRPTT